MCAKSLPRMSGLSVPEAGLGHCALKDLQVAILQ